MIRSTSRQPSTSNVQAWNVVAASGPALATLCDGLVEAKRKASTGHPEIPVPEYLPPMAQRRRALGYRVYEAKGIARDDKPRRIWWAEEMMRFFGAPTAIYVHTPKAMSPYVLADMGMIGMCIMLLAAEKGLGTCPMFFPVEYPEVIKSHLPIPEENVAVFSLALGYPEWSDPVNHMPREREPLSGMFSRLE